MSKEELTMIDTAATESLRRIRVVIAEDSSLRTNPWMLYGQGLTVTVGAIDYQIVNGRFVRVDTQSGLVQIPGRSLTAPMRRSIRENRAAVLARFVRDTDAIIAAVPEQVESLVATIKTTAEEKEASARQLTEQAVNRALGE